MPQLNKALNPNTASTQVTHSNIYSSSYCIRFNTLISNSFSMKLKLTTELWLTAKSKSIICATGLVMPLLHLHKQTDSARLWDLQHKSPWQLHHSWWIPTRCTGAQTDPTGEGGCQTIPAGRNSAVKKYLPPSFLIIICIFVTHATYDSDNQTNIIAITQRERVKILFHSFACTKSLASRVREVTAENYNYIQIILDSKLDIPEMKVESEVLNWIKSDIWI